LALLNCVDCGKQVSDKASACPNCGCPIAETPSAGAGKNPAPNSTDLFLKKLPFETKGLGSTVTFDGKFIVISRGLLNPLGKGSTKIPIQSISSIEWRAPGIQSGFLRFNVAQGLSRNAKLDRVKDAVKDDHAVIATQKHSKGLLELKEIIESML
jgi:hypothetical protein